MIPSERTEPARSALMRKVRRRNTGPEMMVRRLLHREGYRFRLHAGDLPGRPDIVFRRRRKVIFVHGCFWHRHEGCKRTTTPRTRREFWVDKFAANRKRDAAAVSSLERAGWEVVVVWECETEDPERLKNRLVAFLESHHVPHHPART
ncbi:MAG: very short patch repair endonuclease [Chromatiales bacterium]|nr:very short patch repair endonuclease [Chromatiales bacterium]